jgi:Ribbon-helix-helix protein, copG family
MSAPSNKLAAGLAAVRTKTPGTARTPEPEPAGPPPAAAPPGATRARQGSARGGPRWDERVRRHTFHIDVDVLAQLDQVAARTGISKSELVREALRRHLSTF